MSFDTDISTFVQKTKLKGEIVLKKLAFDGLRLVVRKSPVDTGRFRANWRVGVSFVDKTVNWKEFDKPGQATINRGEQNIGKAKWGSTIWISNNLVYGPPLESGHSRQAPNGMLHISLVELQTNFAMAVAAANR